MTLVKMHYKDSSLLKRKNIINKCCMLHYVTRKARVAQELCGKCLTLLSSHLNPVLLKYRPALFPPFSVTKLDLAENNLHQVQYSLMYMQSMCVLYFSVLNAYSSPTYCRFCFISGHGTKYDGLGFNMVSVNAFVIYCGKKMKHVKCTTPMGAFSLVPVGIFCYIWLSSHMLRDLCNC